MPPVTRCSKTDDHPQGLQGRRSSVYVVPHVSCHLGRHEPALDTTILHVVNEPATNRFGARTQSRPQGSRTAHLVNMTLKALVRDLLPPFGHPAVRWFSGCTRTSEATAHRRSGLCELCPAFSVDSAPLSLLAPQRPRLLLSSHQTSQPGSSAFPRSRRKRRLGLPRTPIIVFARLRAPHESPAPISTSGALGGFSTAACILLVAPFR